MREKITPDNFNQLMKLWSKENKKNKWSFLHLGLAQTVPLQPVFKGNEFGILLARLMAMHLRTYRRNVE